MRAKRHNLMLLLNRRLSYVVLYGTTAEFRVHRLVPDRILLHASLRIRPTAFTRLPAGQD